MLWTTASPAGKQPVRISGWCRRPATERSDLRPGPRPAVASSLSGGPDWPRQPVQSRATPRDPHQIPYGPPNCGPSTFTRAIARGPIIVPVLRGVSLKVRPGRVAGHRRPERLGQEHAAPYAGNARFPGQGGNPLRRTPHRQPAPIGPRPAAERRFRHDFPVLPPPARTDDARKRALALDDCPRRLALFAPSPPAHRPAPRNCWKWCGWTTG